MPVRYPWLCVLVVFLALPASAQEAKSAVSAGDYTVSIGETGVAVAHKGTTISMGSYLNVFNPEYKGSLISSGDAYKKGQVSVSPDGHTVTLEAKLPKGSLTYSATVSEAGVSTTARVAIVEGAAVGPVECSWFQIPPAVINGGEIEMHNVAGTPIDNVPISDVPKRGGMAKPGDVLIVKTAERQIMISSSSPITLYPFDARLKQYDKKQGLWAFSGMPVAAGQETVATLELKVLPAEAPAAPGTVSIGPNIAVTAVATALNPSAREKLAADEIVAYLARIAGKKLDVIEISDATVPPGVIAVGKLAKDARLMTQEELDAFQRDGYVVKVAQGKAAVCGWRDLGTVYGAYALIQHLGVRFYAPGCEVVPKIADLKIAECDLRAKPFYEFRMMTRNLKLGHTPNDDCGDPHEIGEPGGIVHAAAYLLPYEKYHNEHPEYFALQKDGQRLHGEPGQPGFDIHLCLSNPDVRRISAERMLALIEKQKDRTFFGVSQGDGFAWCLCEKCKALDAVPGKEMTDRLLDYVNYIARQVAEKYPDKRILTLAYTNATSPPPTRVMPEPNVMVQYCPYPARTNCQSHYFDCEQNKQGFEDVKGWIAKCPKNLYIFDYPCGYKVWCEPFGSFYAMKRKLDFYAENGIRGIFYCGVPTNFRDLFVFVQSRLLWDPKADVEALIDEFMNAYYGKAAPYMREYFNYMHKQVDERKVHQMCEGANPGLVTADSATKSLDLFAKAELAVANDRAELYRVRVEKFYVLFSDLDQRNLVNGKMAESREEFARRLVEFVRLGRMMKVSSFGRRDAGVASDWLCKVARIRPQVQPWFADPMMDRLMADPLKTLAEEQRRACQTAVPGGWLLELAGFGGCRPPAEYSYQCPPRRAICIYGKRSRTPAMWATLCLDTVPNGQPCLALVAQDDDKPGTVRIQISVNGREVFAGPNTFKECGWSSEEIPIPAGVLKPGENEIRFTSLEDSDAKDAKWFMLAECKVLFK